MKIETPLIALMLGSVVFGGLILSFLSVGETYGVNTDVSAFETHNGTSISESLDRWTRTKNEMDNVTASFESEELTDTGSLYAFWRLALTTGKMMLSSVNLFQEMVSTIAQIMGIPTTLITALVAILLITLVVSIIMLLIGRANY